MKLILISRCLDELSPSDISVALSSEFGSDYEFHLLYPEEVKYKVSEIKKLTAKLARKSEKEHEKVVYVLMKGGLLSPICQNALLKTLEDSSYSIFISVKNLDSLLPTINSRCQSVYLDLSISGFDKEKKDFVCDYNFDDIPSLSKLEREKVKELLEETLNRIEMEDFEKILLLQDAIKKIEANCKVESVLWELFSKVKTVSKEQ